MKVRKLPGPPYEKLQCQLPKEQLAPNTLGWKGYRERRAIQNGQQPSHCMRHATWEIDGVQLCTQHAGMRVLEHMEQGT